VTFGPAERIADAVMYEGYVLYPYRASADKNRLRWQFGVVAPAAPTDDGEPSFLQTECLIEVNGGQSTVERPRLWVRFRGLRPSLVAGGVRPWLKGTPTTIDALVGMPLSPDPSERVVSLDQCGVDARLVVRTLPMDTFVKLQLVVENHEPWMPAFIDRDRMLERSLVAAHLLIAVASGSLVSLLEPPPHAVPLVNQCHNRHTWPVLVGDRSQRSLMLSAPVVLYDYPAIATESPGDLCDAAEIDEILSLRILTLTDDEKREARATDPRARAILDRVEALGPEALAALHGTMRSADFFNPSGTPSPDDAFVLVDGQRVAKGSSVRLRPNRRADAMDMFLKDQDATVAGVYRDVDERVYVAVTVDADPASTLHGSFGRFFYFDPSEVEPLGAEQERI
jgi:hypothetical protein